jgi:hypothetical protein
MMFLAVGGLGAGSYPLTISRRLHARHQVHHGVETVMCEDVVTRGLARPNADYPS